MRILFNDILADCVVSATNTDSNFPVANLSHPFMRRRWQSLSNTDTITIEPTTFTSISGIYLGYTNAEKILLTVYGYNQVGYNGDVLGYDGDELAFNDQSSGIEYDMSSGVFHQDLFFSVVTVEVTAPVGEKVYLGKIALGDDYRIDPPESFWEESFDDKSIVSVSDGGQVLQEFVEPLRRLKFSIPTMDRDETRAFQAQYVQCGVGRPIFIDPETDNLPILYCRFSSSISTSKNKRQYRTQMEFTEAR